MSGPYTNDELPVLGEVLNRFQRALKVRVADNKPRNAITSGYQLDESKPRQTGFDEAAHEASVNLCWTRAKIAQWGRRCRATGLGYPSMSTTEKARIGRGGRFNGPSLPPDLEEVDRVISQLPAPLKVIIVEVYTKHGTSRTHAGRLGLSIRDYWRRKTRAEEAVRNRLQVLAQ